MSAPSIHEPTGHLVTYISKMDHNLSERSKREYAARMREVRSRLGEEVTSLTPDTLLRQIHSEATEGRIAPSTFRQYKAAAIYWLAQQAQALIASGGELSEHARVFDALRGLRSSTTKASKPRTSATKLKQFPAECVAAIQAHIAGPGARHSATATRAMAFLRANLLVGLRPGEWFDSRLGSYIGASVVAGRAATPGATILQFEHMLIVDNAKATHGRANGPYRELLLHGITAADLRAIAHFSQIAAEFKRQHPEATDAKRLGNMFFRPINTFIRRTLLASGYSAQDVPSVYSTRHQVVADAKASGLLPSETAAFFGHSSTHTSREHYGLKRHGQRAFSFRASPESLAQVATARLRPEADAIPQQLAETVDRWAQEHGARRGS